MLRSFTAHAIFIAVLVCVSLWNGANYYFEYWVKHYVIPERKKVDDQKWEELERISDVDRMTASDGEGL